ncbi:unnamed protein product [Linum trigynum]|uniref:Uncharacterized protein n=1 Tax=Linum trigynum TaxID=586398 RepID=A0AAV2GHX2_9ROSI
MGACSGATLRRCQLFCQWMDEAELIELGFQGPQFTWFRGDTLSTRKASRIYRSLCNAAWNLNFPNTTVQHLPKFHSDHLPILTSVQSHQDPNLSTTRSFKFEAVWATDDRFSKFLADNWSQDLPLQQALEAVTPKLMQWSKDVFGSIHKRKMRLLARLQGITTRLATSFNPGLLKLQIRLEKDLDEVLAQEELIWFQRAKENWVTLGEQNTSYFHHQATRRRRRNKIMTLRAANGDWIEDQQEPLHMILSFYTTLYKEDNNQYEDLMPRNAFPKLRQEGIS